MSEKIADVIKETEITKQTGRNSIFSVRIS